MPSLLQDILSKIALTWRFNFKQTIEVISKCHYSFQLYAQSITSYLGTLFLKLRLVQHKTWWTVLVEMLKNEIFYNCLRTKCQNSSWVFVLERGFVTLYQCCKIRKKWGYNYLTNYPPLKNQGYLYLTYEKGSLPGRLPLRLPGRLPWEGYLGKTTLGRLPWGDYPREATLGRLPWGDYPREAT